MHDRLTELLGVEVVGQVVVTDHGLDHGLSDLGLGRICLNPLDREAVFELVGRLQAAFRGQAQVVDRLHLEDTRQLVRGMVEVRLAAPPAEEPYVLQITSAAVLALVERRLWLGPEEQGDLLSALVKGVATVLEGDHERPLRKLSDYAGLEERYLERLDQALRSAVAGEAAAARTAATAAVAELAPALGRAWRLLPWPHREGRRALTPRQRGPQLPHDASLRHTAIAVVEQRTNRLAFGHTHPHDPQADYPQGAGWLCELVGHLHTTYPAAEHSVTLGRASSPAALLSCFPGLEGAVGLRPEAVEDEVRP
ncbi:MAG: hypothetical protein IPL40_06170 [Proteobacteria bacterium]|nr:hypothetical protein [Pseudomonadota bacterium]